MATTLPVCVVIRDPHQWDRLRVHLGSKSDRYRVIATSNRTPAFRAHLAILEHVVSAGVSDALVLEDRASLEWEPLWREPIPREPPTILANPSPIAYTITNPAARSILRNEHRSKEDFLRTLEAHCLPCPQPPPITIATARATKEQLEHKRAQFRAWRPEIHNPPKCLLFSSVGDANLDAHHSWRGGPMDVWIAYYGARGPSRVEGWADEVRQWRGSKWQNFHKTFLDPTLGPRLRAYDYVLILDDDIRFDAEQQRAWIEFLHNQAPFVSSPAFDQIAPQNWPIKERPRSAGPRDVRWTNFVECTCPCFRADALLELAAIHIPVLRLLPRGFGVDVIMQALMWTPERPFAIYDGVTVHNPSRSEKGVGTRECERFMGQQETRWRYKIAMRTLHTRMVKPRVLSTLALPGSSEPVPPTSALCDTRVPHRGRR